MKKGNAPTLDVVDLRRKAEEKLISAGAESPQRRAETDQTRLVHELQVHQIELEMQNEELRLSRAEAEANLDLYTGLYDFAPIGYFTLDFNGIIHQANLTGASLIGIERSKLVNRSFRHFIAPEFRPAFAAFLTKAFESLTKQSCEVVMLSEDSGSTYVRIEASIPGDSDVCRIAVIDIAESKRAESVLVESREFARSTMDALSAHICVIDGNGIVVAVNKAWLDFAEANPPTPIAENGKRRAESLGSTGVGADYLAVCDAATGLGSEGAREFAAGIREVMAGTRSEFEMEYPCHSPDEQRWFIGRVTHFAGIGSHMVAIAHENITDRKLAEEALRQSEERLSTAVASGSMGIWGLDLRTNTSVWDARTHDMFGIPRETEPTHELWLELVVPEDRALAEASLARVIAEKCRDSVEYRIAHPDGSIRHIQCTTDPVLDEAGAVRSVVGLDLDITERKLAEIALRESEERFRAIASNTPDHIVMQDRQLRYTFVINPQLGLSEDDMIGKTDYVFLPKEEADLLTQAKTLVMESGEPMHYETSLISKDGRPEYFEGSYVPRTDDQGQVTGLIGYFRNTTERKRAEEALKESEARLLTTLDATPFPVALVDLQDNKILFWSRSALTLFGHTAPSTPEWYQLAYPDPEYRRDVVERWKPAVEEARLSGLTVNAGEYRVTRHDGSVCICELYATFRGDNLIVTFNDVTERKLAEEALRESEEKFRSLYESMDIGVIYENADGRIASGNPAAQRILGLTWDEMHNRTSRDPRWRAVREDGTDFPADEHPIVLALKTGKNADDVLMGVHNPRLDGLRWILVSAVPQFRPGESKPLAAFATFTDITERKQAEEALLVSEREFRTLAESMPQIVWVTRPDGWNIYFNQQWIDYTGQTLEESYGHGWNKPFHPDDQQRAWDAWQNATTNLATYSVECRLRRADGEYKWWLIRGVPVMDAQGRVLKWFGTCTDIDEFKRAQEALRASEERLDLALTSSQMGVWELDIAANTRIFDDQTCHLLGIDPAEFDGTEERFLTVLHPDDRESVRESLAKAIAGKAPYAPEYRVIWQDGSAHYINARGSIIRDQAGQPVIVIGTIWDVTPAKQAEQALRESEERHRTILHTAMDGFWLVDMQGNLLEVNEAYCRMSGYSEQELLTMRVADLEAAEADEDTADRIRRIAEQGEDRFESQHRRKDGSLLDVAVSVKYQSTDGNRIVAFLQDITNRKLAQEALRESEARFRSLFEAAPDAIFVQSEGRFVYVNEAMVSLLGAACPEDLLGKEFMDRIAPEYHDGIVERIQFQCETGEPAPLMDQEYMRLDGSRVPVETTAVPIGYQARSAHLVFVRNITKRKAAEVELRRRESLLSKVFDILPVGLWFADGTGQLVKGNPAGLRIWGAEPLVNQDEYGVFKARRMPSGEEIAPDDWALAHSVNEGVTVLDEELEIDCFDGLKKTILNYSAPVLDDDGQVEAAIVVNLDITERKEMETRLRETERMYRQMLDAISDLVLCKGPGSKIVWANKAFTDYYGMTNEQLHETIDAPFAEPDNTLQYVKDDAAVFETGEQLDIPREPVTRYDGEVRQFNTIKSPILDGSGNVVMTVGVSRDITERELAERELLLNHQMQSAMSSLLRLSLENISTTDFLGRALDLVLSLDWLAFEARGAVFLTDRDCETLRLETHRGFREALLSLCAAVPFGHCICGKAARTRTTQFVDCVDEQHETRFDGISPHGHYCVPILSGDRVLGVLALYVKEGHKHNPREVEFLEAVANSLAAAIERKRAEESLRESEVQYRTLADSGQALIWTSGLDMKCNYFNQTWLQFTGRSLEQEMGDGWVEGVHPDDLEQCVETYVTSFSRQESFSMDYRLRRHDGEFCWIQDDGKPRYDGDGHFLGYIGHCLDITERKHAEAMLRESEERLRELFENMSNSVAVYAVVGDGEDFVIAEFNPAAERSTKVQRKDILGRRVTEVFPGVKQIGLFEVMQNVWHTGIAQHHPTTRYDDGRLAFWVENFVYRLPSGEICVIFDDVTERKQAEDRQRLVRRTLELLNDPDESTTTIDSILQLVQEHLGIECAGIRLREEEDFPYYVTNGFPGSFVLAERFLCERNRDGQVERDADGKPVLACMCGNILCGRTDPSLPFFTERGSFWTNSTSELLASTTENERQARTRNRCNGEGYESVALIPLRVGDEIIGLAQYNDHRRDRFTQGTINFLEGLGASIGIALARMREEEEIRRFNEQLETRVEERTAQLSMANKELEAFSHSVSHDLRAPIIRISGMSQALMEDYGESLDEQGNTFLQRVQGEAKRMGSLVDDLLKLSRLTKTDMQVQTLDVSSLAGGVLERLKASLPERDIECVIELGLTVEGDGRLLEIVLENLLSNAVKFTAKRQQARVEFGTTLVYGRPAFYVKDNGAGFDMAYADKLFVPFQRMHKDADYPGTGIGLVTVQRIIHRHGGEIWADAKVGDGATFYFTLGETA